MICRSPFCNREARAFSPWCTACFTDLLERAYPIRTRAIDRPVERLSNKELPPTARTSRVVAAPPSPPTESEASAPSTGRAATTQAARTPSTVRAV